MFVLVLFPLSSLSVLHQVSLSPKIADIQRTPALGLYLNLRNLLPAKLDTSNRECRVHNFYLCPIQRTYMPSACDISFAKRLTVFRSGTTHSRTLKFCYYNPGIDSREVLAFAAPPRVLSHYSSEIRREVSAWSPARVTKLWTSKTKSHLFYSAVTAAPDVCVSLCHLIMYALEFSISRLSIRVKCDLSYPI